VPAAGGRGLRERGRSNYEQAYDTYQDKGIFSKSHAIIVAREEPNGTTIA
jgi:hypothetical protein